MSSPTSPVRAGRPLRRVRFARPERVGRLDRLVGLGARPGRARPDTPLLDRVVLLAALGVAVLRLPFLLTPAEPDEAGYLLVARHWPVLGASTGSLYGHFWVDRPPLLLLVFKVADLLPGPPVPALRLVGALAALLAVGAAAVLGQRVGGRGAARAGAVVAAALTSSEAVGALEDDGELLAVPLALLSMALMVSALGADGAGGAGGAGGTGRGRSPGARSVLLGAAAGIAATGALLTKQNVADGWAFALVLGGLALARRRATPAGVRAAAGFAAGSGAVAAVVVVWAVRGPGLGQLWEATYGFRLAAARVIDSGSHARPDARLRLMLLMLLLSGLAALLAVGGAALLRRMRRGEALAWATGAVVAVEAVGVAGGASFWLHYLVLLVPGSVLLVALLARNRRAVRLVVALVAGSAVAFTTVTGVQWAVGHPRGGDEEAAGRWLAAASRPGDSVVVTYGRANVVLASGLAVPYPLLWSLPVRVRDPQLVQLTALVDSPGRPTWLLAWSDFDTWDLDAGGRMRAAVARHYRPAGQLCGHPVLLDRSVRPRPLPARPRC